MSFDPTALANLVNIPAHTGLDQTAIADLLNAKTIAVTDLPIDVVKFRRRALRLGIPGKLAARITWAQGRTQAAVAKGGADEILLAQLVQSRSVLETPENIDMTVNAEAAEFNAALTLWQSEGFITNNQRLNLLELANGLISQIEQTFGRGRIAMPADVLKVRA